MRQGLLRVVLCMAGLRLTMGLLGPLLLDAGVDMSQLGWLLGAFSLLAGLAGTLAGGLLVRRAPGWRAVWLALAAQAALLAALAALAAAAPAHPAFLPGLTGLMGLFFASAGCLWVALYAVLMQAASPLQPGVDFSLFQSADALVAVAGGVAAGAAGRGRAARANPANPLKKSRPELMPSLRARALKFSPCSARRPKLLQQALAVSPRVRMVGADLQGLGVAGQRGLELGRGLGLLLQGAALGGEGVGVLRGQG